MLMPTVENLATIKIVFLSPGTLTLCGIPYEMRADVRQQPRHLWDASVASWDRPRARENPGRDWRDEWIYLGEPGWFGSMTAEQVALTKAFHARLKERDEMPGHPYEWNTVSPEYTGQCGDCGEVIVGAHGCCPSALEQS